MEYVIAAMLALAIILIVVLIVITKKKDTQDETSKIARRLEQLSRDSMLSDKLQREELLNALDISRRSQAEMLDKTLSELRQTMEERLEVIRGTVDEKLTKSLNERLDTNFRQIGQHLSELYQSLGELNRLSGGVQDLNRTLSNVKIRGTWGEQQLLSILSETMTPAQYEKNVITKRGSQDRVEFAIKLPGDGKNTVLLPIDSKLPTDIYGRIYDAASESNPQALSAAVKELEQRIKQEAKTISAKYIDPPYTTDFAVMFLPTEGLYAEVLRIDGLAQWCQTTQRVMIAGPATITALLNSLRVGFANAALNEKSVEVMKLLMAVKAQYRKFGEQIDSVQQKLDAAMKSTEELKHRSEIIGRKMGSIEDMDEQVSKRILEIGDQSDDG